MSPHVHEKKITGVVAAQNKRIVRRARRRAAGVIHIVGSEGNSRPRAEIVQGIHDPGLGEVNGFRLVLAEAGRAEMLGEVERDADEREDDRANEDDQADEEPATVGVTFHLGV